MAEARMSQGSLANHKYVDTDCSVNTTIKGKTYCFSSKDLGCSKADHREGGIVDLPHGRGGLISLVIRKSLALQEA
jgi:hypothetical protein